MPEPGVPSQIQLALLLWGRGRRRPELITDLEFKLHVALWILGIACHPLAVTVFMMLILVAFS